MEKSIQRGRRVELSELQVAISKSWGRDTSNDWKGWSQSSPSYGQCAVTSLVVQDYFGGRLMRVDVIKGGSVTGSHYYNELPNGRIVDFTIGQFGKDVSFGPPAERTREYVLSNTGTSIRYKLLSENVKMWLGDYC